MLRGAADPLRRRADLRAGPLAGGVGEGVAAGRGDGRGRPAHHPSAGRRARAGRGVRQPGGGHGDRDADDGGGALQGRADHRPDQQGAGGRGPGGARGHGVRLAAGAVAGLAVLPDQRDPGRRRDHPGPVEPLRVRQHPGGEAADGCSGACVPRVLGGVLHADRGGRAGGRRQADERGRASGLQLRLRVGRDVRHRHRPAGRVAHQEPGVRRRPGGRRAAVRVRGEQLPRQRRRGVPSRGVGAGAVGGVDRDPHPDRRVGDGQGRPRPEGLRVGGLAPHRDGTPVF